MGSVCAEQHKLQSAHDLLLGKKSPREIDIPSRKLLSRRASAGIDAVAQMFADSPRVEEAATLIQKYLPYNGGDDDEDADPYSSDHFHMYEFKVRRCTRSRNHDWTDCPFAHPGEKARRRDPRRYLYSGTVCADFRRGSCSRGDNCEFAHGVFECWLHPARYRTEACKDGKDCKRKVCFFAHSPKQLRLLPPSPSSPRGSFSPPLNSPVSAAERKYRNSNHCCVYCCQALTAASPTSTLIGMSHLSPPISPSLSPPLSPMRTRSASGLSSAERYSDRIRSVDSCGLREFNHCNLSYTDVLTELMGSLESMNVGKSSEAATSCRNLPWMDVSFCNSSSDEQPEFILSPSTPSPPGSGDLFNNVKGEFCSSSSFPDEKLIDNGSACPDLGWVNDLLT